MGQAEVVDELRAVPRPRARNPLESTDGRVRRGERNREAIADALLALYEEGQYRPTARQVAERAGVALRSVFQHYDSIDSLHEQVVLRHMQQNSQILLPPRLGGDRSERLATFVDYRVRMYEAIGPVRRATVLGARESDLILQVRARADTIMRAQVEAAFAPELALVPDRTALLDALDWALSWSSWDQLRTNQGLDVASAGALIASVVERVLGAIR